MPNRPIERGDMRDSAWPVTTRAGNSADNHPATQPMAHGDPRSSRAPARQVSLASAASCAPWRNASAPAREHREVTLAMCITKPTPRRQAHASLR
ncbi:Uncharacterised protein [Mycobacterium tuberculosis]|uniref:Uncharacterized protein n=2 Tax=Mycobacterium tuberculosis TaxID=1773 RepID=A0A916LBE5_MYCTX|nr:Uncharacterised protein [Mycobacterium tuberculosis]